MIFHQSNRILTDVQLGIQIIENDCKFGVIFGGK